MNKVFRKIIMLSLPLAMVSCHNVEREFDDFGLTTVCFPYQTPARTLILGNYEQGFNDNDNNHCFEIGVTMSGLYKNEENRLVEVEVDNSILQGVTNVEALPSNYYEILTTNPVVIPEGQFKGRIKIRLTDEFFKDPKAIAPRNNTNYVIPMKIVKAEKIDSVLCGKALVENPNRLKNEDWSIAPKDYTLFGIKFVNPYDGYFLRRGLDKVTDATGVTNEIGYHQKYVENDELVRTSTESLTCAVVPTKLRRVGQPTADMKIKINFTEENVCDVLDAEGNKIGTGEYVSGGDAWGGKNRDVIHLQYAFNDAVNNEKHEVSDTLVMRDRDIVFEKFNVAF